MSSLGINQTHKVVGNHGNSGNLGMPASANPPQTAHQLQSATIAERAQQLHSSMTTAPPLNATTISSKRSIVDLYNHVPISQQTQQQQPQHLLRITQHQQRPPLPFITSTEPFVVHTQMPIGQQQEQRPLPRISSKRSIVTINNHVPLSTHQAQHQHHQLQITQHQQHSQLPVMSSRAPIVVPKQQPVMQQQGPITQQQGPITQQQGPRRPQPPVISSKKSIVVQTQLSFTQQQRRQWPDLSSKQSIAVHSQTLIMQQAQRQQEQQPPVPQTAPKTPFVMHTQLPIMQPQIQQQVQRITQQQPPPFAPPYLPQQQNAPLTHTSRVVAKLPNGLAGPGGGITLTGGGIVNAVPAGPAGVGPAYRGGGISAAPASSALANVLAAPDQKRRSLPGLQKTAVGYSAASRATMTSQQTLLPTVTAIRKTEDNSLAARRTKSAPGLQQGNSSDTNAHKYRKVVGGKKEIPRAMSLGIQQEVSPQAFLDRMISACGHCTNIFSSLEGGYYCKPTPLQTASYGIRTVQAVRSSNAALLTKLLQCGLSPNSCNAFGESIVHMACRRGDFGILQVLVNAGCSLQVTDDFGRTPLHDACWSAEPNFDIVKIILHADERLFHIVDCRGSSPLSYVRKGHWGKWIAFFQQVAPTYWPPRQGKEAPPALVLVPPHSRPLPDPVNAAPISVAEMIASGKLEIEDYLRGNNILGGPITHETQSPLTAGIGPSY